MSQGITKKKIPMPWTLTLPLIAPRYEAYSPYNSKYLPSCHSTGNNHQNVFNSNEDRQTRSYLPAAGHLLDTIGIFDYIAVSFHSKMTAW